MKTFFYIFVTLRYSGLKIVVLFSKKRMLPPILFSPPLPFLLFPSLLSSPPLFLPFPHFPTPPTSLLLSFSLLSYFSSPLLPSSLHFLLSSPLFSLFSSTFSPLLSSYASLSPSSSHFPPLSLSLFLSLSLTKRVKQILKIEKNELHFMITIVWE